LSGPVSIGSGTSADELNLFAEASGNLLNQLGPNRLDGTG
jgi:hypothetical protein